MTHRETTLIVTVDTEEEGLWSGTYRRRGNTVENVQGARRFQALCDEFSITPTYLVDTPVVEDDAAVELLKGFQDAGRAEVGAHLHPWCTPPFEEEATPANTYMCNLPEALQRAKLAHLTTSIEHRFGHRPSSFRAGRYGLDMLGARALADLGFKIDSSVVPFQDLSEDKGPNFVGAPVHPYHLDGTDLRLPHRAGILLEAPVSFGFNRANFQRAHQVLSVATRPVLRRLRAVGILDRLGLVRRIKFCPETAGVGAMRRLATIFRRHRVPCLVMTMHSSSFVAGYSPYCPTRRDLERFFDRLRLIFDFCTRHASLPALTLSGFASGYGTRPAADPS